MENKDVEIALKKIDLFSNRICFNEKILDEVYNNLTDIDLAALNVLLFINIFKFYPSVLIEILKFSENFYNKSKKQYDIDTKEITYLVNKIESDKRKFSKITNQLKFLSK